MPAPTGEIAKRSKLKREDRKSAAGYFAGRSLKTSPVMGCTYLKTIAAANAFPPSNKNPATEAGYRASNKRGDYSAAASCVDALATSLIADIT